MYILSSRQHRHSHLVHREVSCMMQGQHSLHCTARQLITCCLHASITCMHAHSELNPLHLPLPQYAKAPRTHASPLVQAASAQASQGSQSQQSGIQAVRSKVQGTAHKAWATGTTRLSRLGNALHLDRLNLDKLKFGKAWRAVFQFLSDMWERLRALLLSAWHWVQDSGQKLGGKLRATAQHKAQAT